MHDEQFQGRKAVEVSAPDEGADALGALDGELEGAPGGDALDALVEQPASGTVESELAMLAAQRDEYLSLAQRTQADFENYRKRVAREAASAEQRGVGRLARELLPALDSLDRALEVVERGDDLLRQPYDAAHLGGLELARAPLAVVLEVGLGPLGERQVAIALGDRIELGRGVLSRLGRRGRAVHCGWLGAVLGCLGSSVGWGRRGAEDLLLGSRGLMLGHDLGLGRLVDDLGVDDVLGLGAIG